MRPLTLDDLPLIPEVSGLAISPDGGQVAWVVETADEAANRSRRRLMLLRLDRPGRPVTVVRGGHGIASPRWSPDGSRLAYVDDRGGSAQLWAWDAASRRRTQLTRHPGGVAGGHGWSPDGRRLVVIADGAQRLDDPVPVAEADPRRRVIRTDGHRHKLEGRGFLGEARRHLWIVDADDGAMRQLTDGDAEDDAPAWSPDGRSVAFMADRSGDRDGHFGGEQIHVVDIATRAIRRLTAEGVTCANPAWSPDGCAIAYLRAESPNQVDGHHERLWAVEVGSGRETPWTDGLDRPVGFRPGGYRTPSPPAWMPDSDAVIQLLSDGGSTRLALFRPGAVAPLTQGAGIVEAFVASEDRSRIAFLRTDVTTPVEPWLLDAGEEPRRLWSAWPDALAAVRRPGPGRRVVERPDGIQVDSWLTVPPGKARVPLVLSIHGGPHNAFGERFAADVQLLVSAGYAVLQANPRGSGGYGEAFGRSVVGDWGGADLADLLAVLDEVLAAHPRLDPDRVAVLGGSYGGFMVTWAITQTDRFRCALAGAPVTWFEGMALTSDIGPSWGRAEYGGWPWERSAYYAERSPLAHAGRVRTPVLLFHGEADIRVPISQSEAYLAMITAHGGRAELLRVPGEGHALPGDASPIHARATREAILEWLARWMS